MKSYIQFLVGLSASVVLSIGAVASVHETNDSPGFVKKVTMYTVVDNGEWGVTTFSCEHYLRYGQTLHFDDQPPVRYMMIGILWLSISGGGLPDEENYDWRWEDIPGYPVGRTWNGVTIEGDFPSWNWSSWPNAWHISDDDGDPNVNAYNAAASYWEAKDLLFGWQAQQGIDVITGETIILPQERPKVISKAKVRQVTINRLVHVWLLIEVMKRVRELPYSYVTYEKFRPASGQVYAGKTEGVGTAQQVLDRRDAAHIVKNNMPFALGGGYDRARMSSFTHTRFTGSAFGYAAMRGREQQLIDYHGGAASDPNRGYYARYRSTNAIRAIAKDNVIGKLCWMTANFGFGEIAFYTGNPMFGMLIPPDSGVQSSGVANYPYFWPN